MAWGRDTNFSDQVAYGGRVWQTYRGSNSEIRVKSARFDGSDPRDIQLPGTTPVRPTIWTDYWHQFIAVGHRGMDRKLYHMASGDGFSWPAAWEDLGGDNVDAPVGRSFRHGRLVYTTQGSNGRYRNVYNGSWSGWEFSPATEIALGTNLIDWDSQYADLDHSLDVLRPEVVRFRFGARRVDIIEYLINNRDLRTVIFNGPDDRLTWDEFWTDIHAKYGWNLNAMDIAQRFPNHNFIYELGNEPDQTSRWSGNAAGARDAVVQTANNWRQFQQWHPNFQIGVSLPTRNDGGSYFETFCNNGATLNAFDVVCVHGYGTTCMARNHGDGVHIVDRVKQLTPRAIYITEANLDIESLRHPVDGEYRNRTFADTWEEIGKRLVNGLSQWDGPDGQVRGVCMFETDFRNSDYSNYRFHMDTEFNTSTGQKNAPLPRLGHQAMGQRARSASGCPKYP